LPALNNLF